MKPAIDLVNYAIEYMPDGGAFEVKSCVDAKKLRIIASVGAGWDHVSVSRHDRLPNWREMNQVKHIFFKPEEWAMELHPPLDKHINIHPRVLHLWRPHDVAIPLPPDWMV